ncbi:MAG TPA: DUF1318 domain-containing protein [Spirochaetota bacterium]|nr:DUF1318 domain-containing protein [Spirochaetota bacterium]
MRCSIAFLLIITAAVYSASGCKSTPSCLSVVPPSLNLTSEKTVVERQIIGDYMELEKDAWVIASVKTPHSSGRTKSDMTGDPELLKAEKLRSFHAERLALYKSEGAAGEASDGFAAYIQSEKYESDPAQKKILLAVIDEENMARKIIFRRSLFVMNNAEPSADEVKAFGRIFAGEQMMLAGKGEWIQENSGKWVKKK